LSPSAGRWIETIRRLHLETTVASGEYRRPHDGGDMRLHSMSAPRATRRGPVKACAAIAAVALTVAACGGSAGGDDGGDDGGDGETQSAEDFFAGQTIRWVVPFAAGGGTDVAARQLAALLPEHIPGKPSIQVENIEGGNSVLGVNQFAADDPDGLTILQTSSSTSTPFLFGDPSVQFDFADFEPIIGVPAGAVQYVSSRTGVEDPADLYSSDEPLIYGGIAPGGGEMNRLLGFHVLGLDVKEIFGYDSRASIQVAFAQGEVNIDGQTTQTYNENILPLVENGEAVPVYTSGMVEDDEVVRDPAFPDLPHIGEVYEEETGEAPSGDAWEAYKFLTTVTNNLQKPVWIHGDAPAVAIDALKQAFLDLQDSEEYQSDVAETIGYDFVVGDELKKSVTSLTDPPQDVLDWLREFAKDEYDADLAVG
jgi:hypothetical protein